MRKLAVVLAEYKKVDLEIDNMQETMYSENGTYIGDEQEQLQKTKIQESSDLFSEITNINGDITYENIAFYIESHEATEIELQRGTYLSMKNTEKHTITIKKWVVFWSVISIITGAIYIIALLSSL